LGTPVPFGRFKIIIKITQNSQVVSVHYNNRNI